MQWIKASERMPTADDAVGGDVIVRWIHNCGSQCIAVVDVLDVGINEEWLENPCSDIPSPNGRGNHSVSAEEE